MSNRKKYEKPPSPYASSNTPYLIAVIIMAILTTTTIIVLIMRRPDLDNTELITKVIGFSMPTTLSLLAYMKSQQTHLSVNSRLDDFIQNAQDSSLMRGIEQGRQLNREERRSDLDRTRQDAEGE